MARRILIIANPAAGHGRRGRSRLRGIVEALEQRGCRVVLRETRAPGDAERLARTADPGFDAIVAAGGDGTVNEIVNGLADAAQAAPVLGVLPLGTGNVLANEIGMPRRPAALARVIAEAPPRPIWPGLAGGRRFLAMAGVGFDAAVLAALDPRLKRHIGKFAFIWAICWCLLRYRRREFVVEADGREQRAAAVIVVKGSRYAGNFVVAPAARLDLPLLHAVLFRRPGRLAVLRALTAMALGMLDRLPEVSVLAVRTLTLAAGGGPAQADGVEIDGEIVGRLPIAISVARDPLLLVQPPA